MSCRHRRFLARKEKPSIPDMIAENAYQRIFDRMNNEINRLWQRSIFLGTFLVLIFVGYGNVLLRLFSPEECCRKTEFLYESPLNVVCVGISILGVAFSVLWIMMGKGSKAWQEKYERTIYEFESNGNNWNESLRHFARYGITHGRLRGIMPEEFSDCVLSLKSGGFSPSRINILIGQLSCFFWCFIGLIHIFLYSDWQSVGLRIGVMFQLCPKSIVAFAFLIIVALSLFVFPRFGRSGVIRKKQEQESKRRVRTRKRRSKHVATIKTPNKETFYENK